MSRCRSAHGSSSANAGAHRQQVAQRDRRRVGGRRDEPRDRRCRGSGTTPSSRSARTVAAVKLLVIDAMRNEVVAVGARPSSKRAGSAAHGQTTVDHHAPRQRRAGVLGPDVLGEGLQLVGDVVEGDHVCRCDDGVGEPPQLGGPVGGRRGRADDELGEPGVDPASDEVGQGVEARVRRCRGCRRRRGPAAPAPGGAPVEGVGEVDPEVLVGDRPAGLGGRGLDGGPPGDGVVQRDAAGEPAIAQASHPVQRLGHLPPEPHLQRFLPRAGVERQAVDLLAGPPPPHPGQVLVEPRRAVAVGQALGGPLGRDR